jgi:hypothetical protein
MAWYVAGRTVPLPSGVLGVAESKRLKIDRTINDGQHRILWTNLGQ